MVFCCSQRELQKIIFRTIIFIADEGRKAICQNWVQPLFWHVIIQSWQPYLELFTVPLWVTICSLSESWAVAGTNPQGGDLYSLGCFGLCGVLSYALTLSACLLTGADVQRGCGQDSPLHAAVQSGGADIVDLLLDFGANGCCRNAEGKTPLHLSSPDSAVRIALQKRGLLLTLMSTCLCSSNSTRSNSPTHCLCPCLHRSLLPDADLSVLYSPKFGMDSPPQSLQPPPSPQHQGLSSLSIRHVGEKPSCSQTKGVFYQFLYWKKLHSTLYSFYIQYSFCKQENAIHIPMSEMWQIFYFCTCNVVLLTWFHYIILLEYGENVHWVSSIDGRWQCRIRNWGCWIRAQS